jgi:DNA-binding transcriptional regulator LsrR (DeoR family)
MDATLQHKRLLYKIARDYYLQNLTQNQIAQRLGLSRIKVSRLLRQAKREQIVTITLAAPSGVLADLEEEIESRYGLEEAVVVASEQTRTSAGLALELAPAAAECLIRRLSGEETVGISWGTTLKAVVDAISAHEWPGIRIVQLTGGLGPVATQEHSTELARRMAEKFCAKLHLLSAPGIASDRGAAEAFRKDRQIADTLALAARVDVAVVGIGVLASDAFLMKDGRILSQKEFQQLKKAGAVGDIGLRAFDAAGSPVELEINDRVIGLTFEQLRKIPCLIAVAGGEEKVEAIRGALSSGIPKVLVTDGYTARRLLKEGP